MRKWIVWTALLVGLLAAPLGAAPRLRAQKFAPDVSSLARIVFAADAASTPQFGVYLGEGIVVTPWHAWTLDGDYYTEAASPLSPSRAIPRYDDDGVNDPGENMLTLLDCRGRWTRLDRADPDCTPFVRLGGAGFVFPLAEGGPNDQPVPIERLLYANRSADIAVFQVNALAVESRGVRAAPLSLVPASAGQAVLVAYGLPDGSAATLDAALDSGEPALLPAADAITLGGPWRVPSLVLDAAPEIAIPPGAPVYDRASGDLLGLAWRPAAESGKSWVTPTARWGQDLFAANDEIHSDALNTVLAHAAVAPVDAPPTLGDPLAPELGNGGIDVQHYALKLDFDLAGRTLAGIATLDIRATLHQLYTFSLDAQGLAVDAVTVNGVDAPFLAKAQKLLIQLPAPVAYGTLFQVAITYHAAPQPFTSAYMPYFHIGLFMEGSRAYSLNELDGARTWFPCNDHPSDRASYDFYLRVPDPLEAVANGRLLDVIPGDGAQTYHWQMAEPMATYLVVVALGDYVTVDSQSASGVPIRDYVYPDKVQADQAAFGYTPTALTMLEGFFGTYPFASYGHVFVPGGAMALETQSLSTMPDAMLDLTESDVFALMVHELAHQWFGDRVTIGAWNDIWLNEGFATYAEWLVQEQRYGVDAAVAARSASEQALISDKRTTPLIAPAPGETFGISSYDQGAWLLHMLRDRIGEEAFFKLLRAYGDTFRDRPAQSLDFWRLAEETSGQDLGEFFSQWLLQGGIPRYTLYWSQAAGGADVLLCSDSTNRYHLTLDLAFSAGAQHTLTPLEVNGTSAQASLALDFAPDTLTVDPQQAVLAQVQVQPIAQLPAECPAPGTQTVLGGTAS